MGYFFVLPFTVTTHLSNFLFPMETVMTAVPFLIPLIIPDEVTVTIFELEDKNLGDSAENLGFTIGLRSFCSPSFIESFDSGITTLMAAGPTETLQVNLLKIRLL